jgi:hypothetical protein
LTAKLVPFSTDRVGTLSDQRVMDLIDRARHGRLPIAKDIIYEYTHFIVAVSHNRQYGAAQRAQKLKRLLEQYDQHLRKTRARVRRYDLPFMSLSGEQRPTSEPIFGDFDS